MSSDVVILHHPLFFVKFSTVNLANYWCILSRLIISLGVTNNDFLILSLLLQLLSGALHLKILTHQLQLPWKWTVQETVSMFDYIHAFIIFRITNCMCMNELPLLFCLKFWIAQIWLGIVTSSWFLCFFTDMDTFHAFWQKQNVPVSSCKCPDPHLESTISPKNLTIFTKRKIIFRDNKVKHLLVVTGLSWFLDF